MTSQVEEKQAPPKKKTWKLIIGLVLLVALASGIFGYFSGNLQLADLLAREEKIKSVTLPSLTVNLADRGYVKTTITIEYVSTKNMDKAMEENSYELKDSAIKVLRNTSFLSLQNPQATENLKKSLLQEINTTLAEGKITGLYFEEFLVQ